MKNQEYLSDAQRWEDEIYSGSVKQLSIWKKISAALLGVVLLLAFALAAMMPLKEFRPYVITVDSETGRASASYLAQSGPISEDEAVIRSLIGNYVIQRETYDLYDGQQRYENISQMSISQALESYRALWMADNPDYPFKRYGRDTKISVYITSISMLNSNTANVQYEKTEVIGGNRTKTRHVAIVGFSFIKKDTSLIGIIRNPLGFVVQSWRADQVYTGR